MKTTIHWLPILLGCTGLATISLGMPTQALGASCGRPMYASGPHALAAPAGLSGGTGLSQRHDSIAGLWHVVYTSGGMTVQESFDSWHADGNEFEAADLQLGAMCQGTWVKTVPGTVRLFHVGWNFDPTGVTLIGYFTENQVDTLSADGMSYDGTFALQNFDMLGNHIVGQDLKGTVHATRLTVP
jgi:hypothetical protein